MNQSDVIKQCASVLKDAAAFSPDTGIILGTGLGGLADKIQDAKSISYDELPGFPHSTVQSHAGRLTWGTLGTAKVIAMEGRFHYYEGYSLDEITLPIRVMKELGIKKLIVSNAAGGMNPMYENGDIVLIEDHINLMGINPLIGPNDDKLGPRFPDMIEPYSYKLIRKAEAVALKSGIKTHRGVYVGVSGPNLETRAEYRFLRTIGADLVGMSTIPEVITAVHAGLEVLGVSCVTDMCLPDALKPANIDEIIATAEKTEPQMCHIVSQILGEE
ncbi:MAG: purine-nucleoside phosphorylase [Planctomycetes bacterium]|nr:purine-nucleoside phosphorylase [Planctomycetota bacterium]